MAVVSGIDVGARRLHMVLLDDTLRLADAAVLDSSDIPSAVQWLRDAEVVAIDAPDRPSAGPRSEHADVGLKFRTGRCAEIGLGREFRLWVPWVTPYEPPYPSWMERGFELFKALEPGRTIEVYPHAIFRVLADLSHLPKKSEIAGSAERIRLLAGRGVSPVHIEMWSHDALDALAAAVVALDHLNRRARSATCGHDGSVMWLPAALEPTAG